MKFGPVPVREAEGAILAHSMRLEGGALKKGRCLSGSDICRLESAGVRQVVAARPGDGDLAEDDAAARIAHAIAPVPAAIGMTVAAPFTGRANLFAAGTGVLQIDCARVAALNALDEALTLATLPDMARVAPRQMLATVKIIPYAISAETVAAAERLLADGALMRVHAPVLRSAALILTRTPGMKETLLGKGADAVRQRLAGLGIDDVREEVVAHETMALARAIADAREDIVLILTASATSDRADVGPSALIAAGGKLERFGMPVDPGNLLFLGASGGRPVVGLPGCARSPAINGADWVIERLTCGLPVSSGDIAAMGVGGLLKEIPSRPEPRAGGATAPSRPRVAAILLAAGASSRMGGRDKLLEPVDGIPLVRRSAERLLASQADEVICVLRANSEERRRALDGLSLRLVENPRAEAGMGTSLACGIAALGPDSDAALIVLADMPDVAAADVDRLISAFDPGEGRAIVRAVDAEGRAGHPVLFGRRFFEALGGLDGDSGARDVLRNHPEFVVDVALPGHAALTDLDTPEDWDNWRTRQGAA